MPFHTPKKNILISLATHTYHGKSVTLPGRDSDTAVLAVLACYSFGKEQKRSWIYRSSFLADLVPYMNGIIHVYLNKLTLNLFI